MNRYACRLLALAALLNGGSAPWPTLANDNVFDSQREDLDIAGEGERRPYIVIRTDDDNQTLTLMGNVTSRRVLLRLEIGVLGGVKDTAGHLIVDWPRSDSGIESFLDLFEWQIQAALIGPRPWADRFRTRFSPSSCDSVPMFIEVDQTPVRIAARELTFTIEAVDADEFPPRLRETDIETGNPYVPALPGLLLEVFALIDSQGDGALKANAARVKTLLERQNLPDAGIYPPMTSLLGRFTLSDATAPPTGQEPQPQVTAEMLQEPETI